MKSKTSVALLALLIVAAIALDTLSPPRAGVPRGVSVPTAGGVLSCPIATDSRASGYLHLANVAPDASQVRVSLIPATGKTVVVPFTLEPSAVSSLSLYDKVKGAASAVVEYAGGEVVASHLLVYGSTGSATGAAEAPCLRTSGVDVVVGPGGTLGSETTLAIFNPGSSDADITVTLVGDGRRIRPERLTKRVIPARTRRDFRLGDFVFDARDVFALIHSTTGRVVAEALLVAPQGTELIPAQDPGVATAAIAGASGAGAAAAFATSTNDRSALATRLIGGASQGRAPGIAPELEPAGVRRVAIPSTSSDRAVAYVANVSDGAPLVSGTTWTTTTAKGRDLSVLPAAPLATRWGGVLGTSATTATARILIVNPGSQSVRVRVVTFGKGATPSTDVEVEPGRLYALRLGQGAGVFAADLRADGPVAVAFDATGAPSSGGYRAYGVAATPLRPPASVAVVDDPRVAVPATTPR